MSNSIIIKKANKTLIILDAKTINRTLASSEDKALKEIHDFLTSIEKRTFSEESVLKKVVNEIENRIEHEAKFELGEMNSKDIIKYWQAMENSIKKSRKVEIQRHVAMEILLERHAGLATRAELFCDRNPLIKFEPSFFSLINDIDNH